VLSDSPLAEAVNFERQSITIAFTQEPPNLNSIRMTDLLSYFVIGHVNEGLLRYDKKGRLAPGVAESWEVSDTKISFRLRRNARWSDGTPVTAHDFEFAWKQVNDPQVAAPFAAIMHPLKNAEKIQNAELPVEELGVSAVDDFTLEVTLERPCGYCISLMTHATFFPVKEGFYQSRKQQYGAEFDQLLYNGPFMMTGWIHGSSMALVKNPHYWNASTIHLNEINVGYITEDNRTRLNLFRDGSIALARLDAETVRDAMNQGLRLRTFVTGGVAYVWFNHRPGHITGHRKIRKAMQLSFDTDLFVNKVIAVPGYKPAHTFFPSWLNGIDGKFSSEYPPPIIQPDSKQALRLIQEVKKEMRLESLPEMTLLTVASPTGVKIGEYFQGLLGQSLGIKVKIDQQTFKQYLEKARAGQFDLVLSSWFPDFDDIVTYADLLASWNPNNRGSYVNAEYDRWFRVLQGSTDRRERMDAAAELQKIILDDVPLLPTAETGSAYLQHPKLKGVVRRALGQDPDYTHARVIK
jgi:oligopeptide transport system substrate-binding protein|tara:strand:+ start:4289 stop:5851 length:1563 start_codon:yes stop_codon:yes gene_type:complete